MLADLAIDGGRPIIPIAVGLACLVLSSLPSVCRAAVRGYAGDRSVAKVTCSKVLNVKHISRAIVIRGAA